jgi:hypothetical protein
MICEDAAFCNRQMTRWFSWYSWVDSNHRPPDPQLRGQYFVLLPFASAQR